MKIKYYIKALPNFVEEEKPYPFINTYLITEIGPFYAEADERLCREIENEVKKYGLSDAEFKTDNEDIALWLNLTNTDIHDDIELKVLDEILKSKEIALAFFKEDFYKSLHSYNKEELQDILCETWLFDFDTMEFPSGNKYTNQNDSIFVGTFLGHLKLD